jgi:SynChlorMet cassette protein ScmD
MAHSLQNRHESHQPGRALQRKLYFRKDRDSFVDNNEKPIANPFVLLREEFDDWAVLFDPDAGQGFGLNPTGVYVWKLLDGKHSVDDMLEALHRDADGVPQEAGEHIVTFLEELTEHGPGGVRRRAAARR